MFTYGTQYGIRKNSMEAFAGMYKTKNGNILIGYENGFYDFNPDEIGFSNKPLTVNISDLLINNSKVSVGLNSLLQKPIEETNEIKLGYNQNNISFQFAAIDYRSPESNKYYTMLENYDNTWRDATGDKTAFYLNVPPGKYLFHVKAFNIDGTKAEKIVSIVISPPWWKTWWAYVIYGLLFLLIVLGVHRVQQQRTIRIERQKAQVKELAQAKEIEKAYHDLRSTQAQLIQSEKMASLGELTAGIAHEIQNPLNFVNNFSEVNNELLMEMKEAIAAGNLDEVKNIANDIIDNEQKINHHGKRADSIVKGMLQHSRVSTGQKVPTDINALADEYLRLAYHGLRAKDKFFNVKIQTEFDQGIGEINIVSQDIGRVLLNLYNNSFYAVTEKVKQLGDSYTATVSITTKQIDNKVEIRIKDNGIGIPQKVLNKIFQPFFTTKPTGQGTGLGLALSYDIIKSHNGEIKVETTEGEGSEFIIVLPGLSI
jgi:signal transduction histidine kinase